jgi:hypothetical protein
LTIVKTIGAPFPLCIGFSRLLRAFRISCDLTHGAGQRSWSAESSLKWKCSSMHQVKLLNYWRISCF